MAASIINMKMKYNAVSYIFPLIKFTLIIWIVVLRIKKTCVMESMVSFV